MAVAVVLFAPHAWWLLANDAPPLRYLSDVSDQRWPLVLGHAWRTFTSDIGMNLSVVAVVLIGGWLARRNGETQPMREIRGPMFGVLVTLALGPVALTLASALVLRNPLTDEMTVGIFPLLPLLVIELIGRGPVERLGRLSVHLATALMLGAIVLSPAVAAVRTWFSPVAKEVMPFEEVALDATRLWHERTGQPVGYVSGSPWFENATAFYSPDHPSAFAYFDYSRSLWVTPERLAKRGLLSTLQFNRLPEKVSLELGAVSEPLSVAMHGMRRGSIKKGSNILVFGAGAVGLLCAAMCKVSEAGNVIIADIKQSERVDFALKNKFADAGIEVPMKKCNTIEEKLAFAKEVAGLVYGTKSRTGSVVGEVDAVFECTGVESCLQAAIYVNGP